MISLTKDSEKYVIATFSNEIEKLNIVISDKVKAKLTAVIDDNCRHLIIDLATIKYIDSSGFGSLVTIFNHAKNREVGLSLCNISNETMDLLSITKLDQVFDIKADLKTAIDSISE
ncbi:MAG: STAS domain-containing protein [Salinivirgaceae bacterium]|nr:STAS domain-containing protein [Salinivirgaceae bacterium]